MKKFTKQDWLVLATVLAFLIYKLATLTYRFGDGNAYFYMANSLWHGIWPYRDFFTADPPLLVLFLSLFRPIFSSHWLWYQIPAFLLEAANGFSIYLIFRNKLKSAVLGPILYLFSFSILGTSEFTTGIQLTVFFSLLGWFAFEKDHPIRSGVFFALAAMTKLYALPVFAGVWLYSCIARKMLLKITLGFIATVVVVILPFLILSPSGLFHSIVWHQLHRPAGNDPAAVWSYFLSHEWALLLLAFGGLFLRKSRQYLAPFIFGSIFLIIFKDLYYVYIAYLISYLVFFAIIFLDRIYEERDLRPLLIIAGLLAAWSIIGGVYNYENTVQVHGRFTNAAEIGEFLRTQNVHTQIYGSHEVAPLLALISGKKIFGNFIDTNTQVFAARTLDVEKVSLDAARSGVYLAARITDLPEQGIRETGFEGYFSREVFDKYCSKLKFFPSTGNEADNYIGIYDCRID